MIFDADRARTFRYSNQRSSGMSGAWIPNNSARSWTPIRLTSYLYWRCAATRRYTGILTSGLGTWIHG